MDSETPPPSANDFRGADVGWESQGRTNIRPQSKERKLEDAHVLNKDPQATEVRKSFDFDIEKKADFAELTDSKNTSGSTSPCPDEDEDEDEDNDGKIIVSFEENDTTNPYNWSRPKKLYVVIAGILMVLNSTIGSALPSGTTETIEKDFNIENTELLVLPVSIYLIGYILGPLVFAPLSESYGRKLVMIGTFVMFTVFVLACALAPNFASLIVFRLLVGIGASTPVSVIGGIYADLYSTKRARGLAMVVFMAATTWGPLTAPLISGFASVSIGWRWVYWIELIFAGATWPLLLLMPETYGPVILRRKAKKLRKETDNPNIYAPSELEKEDLWQIVTVVLTRPIRMFLFEAIVLFTCLYLAFAYGVFYMFFQAFQPIFGDIYGFNPGEVGLCFLPIGVGSWFAAGAYLWWDWYLARAKKRPNPPAWSEKEEYNRLPLACFGGPLIVIGLFWLGWTARPDVHWIVPVLSAWPFGIGFLSIFMSLINYVVDAYDVYAASAMGALSASRSIFGVVLPFAAVPMYSQLGVNWACTLLGVLSALMCLVPFVFIKYGGKIRENSKWCQELQRKKEEDEEKQQRLWERQRRDNQRLQRQESKRSHESAV